MLQFEMRLIQILLSKPFLESEGLRCSEQGASECTLYRYGGVRGDRGGGTEGSRRCNEEFKLNISLNCGIRILRARMRLQACIHAYAAKGSVPLILKKARCSIFTNDAQSVLLDTRQVGYFKVYFSHIYQAHKRISHA